MIKARAGNAVILGLEARNIELLQQDKPILVKLKELGLPDITLVIMHGATQADIVAKIESETGLKIPDIDPVNERPL
jgi:hypothetical protein